MVIHFHGIWTCSWDLNIFMGFEHFHGIRTFSWPLKIWSIFWKVIFLSFVYIQNLMRSCFLLHFRICLKPGKIRTPQNLKCLKTQHFFDFMVFMRFDHVHEIWKCGGHLLGPFFEKLLFLQFVYIQNLMRSCFLLRFRKFLKPGKNPNAPEPQMFKNPTHFQFSGFQNSEK